mmetsp:Transcript_47450/g.103131  ORF Transcript_47450/g.103131 Transcript_47450/m.103131 type:complete len:279 (+) Transcript_47450:728-1564(+)
MKAAFSCLRISVAFACVASSSSIWTLLSLICSRRILISPCSCEIASALSSKSRAATCAALASEALVVSHCSFVARSVFSSSRRTPNIVSMAATTASKLPLADAFASCLAKDFSRVSPAAAAADCKASAAASPARLASPAERLRHSCKNEVPCDAKDLLKRSFASSLLRIETAFEIAASSSCLVCFLNLNSSSLVFRSVSVCAMDCSSFWICVLRSATSVSASDLERPRAPPSTSMASRDFSALDFWFLLFSASISYSFTALASRALASFSELRKVFDN